MAPCVLSYASDGGAASICQRGGPKRGCGCLKTAFSCTLDTFIRGTLCSGTDQFPTLVLFFILFLMNMFQGNIFLFPFFLLLFYSPINGGGGMAPLCILAIPVTVVQPRFVNGGKARERSDRARGDFSKFVYETGIFLHIRYHY